MHLSFLFFSETWKHSISPSASSEPADPWWFMSQLMNYSYSSESSRLSHDWHVLQFFVRILSICFPVSTNITVSIPFRELSPLFCHVPSHETVMSHIPFSSLVPSISLAAKIFDWEATLLYASTMFFSWGGSGKFKNSHNFSNAVWLRPISLIAITARTFTSNH